MGEIIKEGDKIQVTLRIIQFIFFTVHCENRYYITQVILWQEKDFIQFATFSGYFHVCGMARIIKNIIKSNSNNL